MNLSSVKQFVLGDKPVVVMPLEKWGEIELLLEDLEMSRSKKLAKDIAKARKEYREGKFINLEELRKRLNL